MYLNFCQQNNNFYESLDQVTLGVMGIADPATVKFKKNIFQDKKTIFLNQVHQKDILVLDKNALSHKKWLTENYDGVISSLHDIALVIKTADCIPILLWQDSSIASLGGAKNNSKYIAALHCGWRSVAQGILKELGSLSQKRHIPIKSWKVCLAPGIQAKNYPVDQKLLTEFSPLISQLGKNKNDFFVESTSYSNKVKVSHQHLTKKQFCFDLKKIILAQLLDLGFLAERIYDFSLCTYSEKFFYSHRENQTPGRNLNFIFKS